MTSDECSAMPLPTTPSGPTTSTGSPAAKRPSTPTTPTGSSEEPCSRSTPPAPASTTTRPRAGAAHVVAVGVGRVGRIAAALGARWVPWGGALREVQVGGEGERGGHDEDRD